MPSEADTVRPTQRAAPIRRAWRTWFTEIAIVLGVFVAMHFWQVRNAASGFAPSLEGTTVNGRPIALKSFAGKPVLVHFWATWCGVCRVEEPTIAGLAKDLPVITVASNSGSVADVSRILAQRKLSFPVLNDPDGTLATAWGVHAFPTTFVIGGDGRIRFVEVGLTSALGYRARMWWAGLQ